MNDPYASIALVYDAVTKNFLQKPYQEVVAILTRLQIRRVLDIGCGTGVLAACLQTSGRGCVGLDASLAMLQQGKKQQRAGAFVQADAAKLPFVPHSFDAVVFSMVLHETSADASFLVQQAFTLAPRVLVLDWRMPERNLDYLLTFWVHGIERLAGKEHYRNFTAYMRKGGLHGLAERAHAYVSEEYALAGQSLVLAVLARKEKYLGLVHT